jgi:hypothetical protein
MLNIIVVYSMENTGKENILLTKGITKADDITQENIEKLKSVPVFAKCLEKHEKKCTDGDCHKGGHLEYIQSTFTNLYYCIYKLVKLFSPEGEDENEESEQQKQKRTLLIMSQMKVEDLGGKKYFKIKNLKQLMCGDRGDNDIKKILREECEDEKETRKLEQMRDEFKFVFFKEERISIYFVIALLSIVSGGFLFLLVIKNIKTFNILPSMRFKICNLRNKHAYFLAVLVLLVLVKFIAYKNYVNKLEDINKKNLNKINDRFNDVFGNAFNLDSPRIFWRCGFSFGTGDIILCDKSSKELIYFNNLGGVKTAKIITVFQQDFNLLSFEGYPASNFFDYNNYYNNPNIDIIETQTSDIITMIITIVLFVIYIFICWWCWRKSPENPQKHSKGQGKVSAFRRVMYSR